MAIIDSIALGKSKGSIGNITFYQLNGQTIARYRNTTPYDPKTPAQLTQRQGIRNTSSAFSLMKQWAKGLDAVKVGKQTYYNRFTSIMVNSFDKIAYPTPLDVIKGVLSGGAPAGNSIYVLRNQLKEGFIRIPLDTNHIAWEQGWFISLGVVNDTENAFESVVEPITSIDWNNGYVDVPIIGSPNYKTFAYAYNKVAKKISDIAFQYLATSQAVAGISNLLFTAGGVTYAPIPTFDYVNSGFYDLYIPDNEFTVSFDWVNMLDEHYMIYQYNPVEIVEPNVYTFQNDRTESEFAIDVIPQTSNEISYVFIIHKI